MRRLFGPLDIAGTGDARPYKTVDRIPPPILIGCAVTVRDAVVGADWIRQKKSVIANTKPRRPALS
jgi:hypothetical protein